jgi:hypothetical protein
MRKKVGLKREGDWAASFHMYGTAGELSSNGMLPQ